MWNNIYYSFPIQLFFLHLKKNIPLLLLWAILLLIILEKFGTVLGIPFLFLDPEYLNEVSWKGFFLMGVAFGVFTMAFHMTTYILDGAKFKFLAVIPRPFIQYCINNAIIPLVFYIVYLYRFIGFQLDNEHEDRIEVFEYFLGFTGGSILIYAIIFSYFAFTNKDLFVIFADSVEKRLRKTRIPRANMLRRIKESKETKNKVLYYLDIRNGFEPVRLDLARFEGHQLLRVFDQNHLNLIIIQSVLILLILFLGFFREYPVLQIPAAMSATLLFAIIMMLIGALAFWLREWLAPVIIIFLLLFNFLSKSPLLNRPHTAFGMNYDTKPAVYNLENLQNLLHPDSVEKDRSNTIQILENWKAKFPSKTVPRMIFITTSGGGQRAALWTLNVLQHVEKASQGKVFNHTQMITGASGGVVGAAFFRELYLRHQEEPGINYLNKEYLHQISSDNLNPIIFTLLVNDLFIRNQYYTYNGREYLQDRGFAFENQLNINTKEIMDKPLKAYSKPEYESKIPMLPITPLITNDGRKLYISPHSMSYMGISASRSEGINEKSQGIDFRRFFKDQDADNLRFISALRMGATFPFITPHIQLPSLPQMETMDAGLSDNFGIQDALRFIYVFQDWIKENTSGVTLITIRDSEKFTEIDQKILPTIFQKLSIPLKNILINWDNIQTLNNEVLYNQFKESMEFDIEKIEFEYSTSEFLRDRGLTDSVGTVNPAAQEIQRASLNWRLTAREKVSIIDNIKSFQNQAALQSVRNIEFLKPKED
ncbi:Patatin-like phospholipase [Belliella baltica DSM 15883]|uniref:Patatin-like phospholipase n=1 Tax=Belliella baltica (strain DSM 15883 / CIP 108006 / LMG 21964 / BA134) TaxID=866536 RepID=I3Z0N9_BELBD|nr:patatin-like phospholipase family protein [Belliella baltica]AFL82807.1 Patatin-like phospholipase [Belliella baltica DSM 15883]